MKRGIVAFVIWAAVLGCALLPSQQRAETGVPRYFPLFPAGPRGSATVSFGRPYTQFAPGRASRQKLI